MTKRKPTTLDVGEISHGTLRTEDLIDATLDMLDSVRLSREDRRLVNAARREFEAMGVEIGTFPEVEYSDDEIETIQYIYEDLESIAYEYVPDYCYFGMHEGDGSSLGVWPILDAVADGIVDDDIYHCGDSHPGECDVPRDVTHAVHVSDHGNLTLYRRSGNRWREVWAIV